MNDRPENDLGTEPPDATQLTWAVLLGRWVEFARSALGLPDDDAGRRMRAAVPDIIMLQAVWFALQHLDELDAEQRDVGLDRAAVLITAHGETLRARFGSDVPDQVRELMDDAAAQLARSSDNTA